MAGDELERRPQAPAPADAPRRALPPIGCSVVRGPDWQWGAEGLGKFGVVVGQEFVHTRDARRGWWCWVEWDAEPNRRLYRYRWGVQGAYDLSIVRTAPMQAVLDARGRVVKELP